MSAQKKGTRARLDKRVESVAQNLLLVSRGRAVEQLAKLLLLLREVELNLVERLLLERGLVVHVKHENCAAEHELGERVSSGGARNGGMWWVPQGRQG